MKTKQSIVVAALASFVSIAASGGIAHATPAAEPEGTIGTVRVLIDQGDAVKEELLTYEVINGRRMYQGDIVLDNGLTFAGYKPESVQIIGNKWPDGKVYYQIDSTLSTQADNIRSALRRLQSSSRLTFIESAPSGGNYITYWADSDCSSMVGMKTSPGEQKISLGAKCYSEGTIQHETMHAVGFFHEQSRQDRDSYVTVDLCYVKIDKEHNFNKETSSSAIGQYDLFSLMHYDSWGFQVNLRTDKPECTGKPATGFPLLRVDGSTITPSTTPTIMDLDGLAVRYGGIAPEAYSYCAAENSYCSFTGTRNVMYGYNGVFYYKTVSGGVMCNSATFGGDPVPGVAKYCAIGLNGFDYCAAEGGTCSFTGKKKVAFGANGSFVYQVIDGGTPCTNAVFGDPISGVAKACYVQPQAGYTFCANEGGTCSFTGKKNVGYGTNYTRNYATFSNGTACNNSVFGDPTPGVAKSCYFLSSGFTHCADEGGQCSFTGTRTVAFGANYKFTYETYTNGVSCSNNSFSGDPIPGVAKACYLF